MNLRRSCVGAVALVLALGLSACGDDDSDDNASAPGPTSGAFGKGGSAETTQPQEAEGGGVDATAAGAVDRFETFLHALGADDRDVICEIAGPGAKSAEEQGFGTCQETYGIVAEMISSDQAGALREATIDRSLVQERGPQEVYVPVEAVQPTGYFTESDLGSYTLRFQDGNWFIVDGE